MSKQDKDASNDAQTQEVQNLLEALKQMRAQAEEQLRATEVARKKADDEATYAYQAKANCEQHAKAAAEFKGSAEADINVISNHKKNFDEALASVSAEKATAESEVKKITDARKDGEQAANAAAEAASKAATRITDIETFRTSAEAAQRATSDALNAVNNARDAAISGQQKIESLAETATQASGEIAEHKVVSKTDSDEIQKSFSNSKNAETELAKIITRLTKSDGKSQAYEEKIESLIKEADAVRAKAESYLPGVTSASLASAFKDQQARFSIPQQRWLRTFVWCIIVLVLISLPSFVGAAFGLQHESTWDSVLHGVAVKLPILAPLVWLAIYAGRNYMLSLRLEEDYAYKEAVSRAFEGYRREMANIVHTEGDGPSPLTTLCNNVLTAIRERPGRIYEGKSQDITLLDEMRKVGVATNELRRKTIATE